MCPCSLALMPASWDHNSCNMIWSSLCLPPKSLLSGHGNQPPHTNAPHAVWNLPITGPGPSQQQQLHHTGEPRPRTPAPATPVNMTAWPTHGSTSRCRYVQLEPCSSCPGVTWNQHTLQHTVAVRAHAQRRQRHHDMTRQPPQRHLQPTAYVTTAKGRGTSAQIFSISPTLAAENRPTAELTVWPTSNGSTSHPALRRQHQYGTWPPTSYVTTAKGQGTFAQILSTSPTLAAVDTSTLPRMVVATHSFPPPNQAQPGSEDHVSHITLDSGPDPPSKLHRPGVSGHPVVTIYLCVCLISIYHLILILTPVGMLRLAMALNKLMPLPAVSDPISPYQAQTGGGPPKPKARRNSKKFTAMLAAAVPGLAEPSTHDPGNSPGETIWVPPADVGLFCEAQNRGYCGVHALNAMANRPAFHAPEAIRLLRHPSTPPPVTGDPDCTNDGWFSMEALCKLLYFTTSIDVALIHIVQTWRQESSGAPHYTQSEILEMAPPNCDAFLVWIPGHYVCWKRSPMNGKWYCLDSIPYGTGPHKGMIRELTHADWWNLNGSLSTTVAADAYLSNVTGMSIKNSRKVLPPINRAEMNYINLTDVPTQSGPTPRPAARWIQEDFPPQHQRPYPISQPQEHSSQPHRPHLTPSPKPWNTSVHKCPHKPRQTGPSPKSPRPPTNQSLKRARQGPPPNKPPAKTNRKHHSQAPKASHTPQPLDNTATPHHSVRQHHSAPNTYACDAGPHTHYTNALYNEPRAHQNPLFVELDDQKATALNPAPPPPSIGPREPHDGEGPQGLTTMQTDNLPQADSVCAPDIDRICAEPFNPQHPQSATKAFIPHLSHTTPRHSARPRPPAKSASQTKPRTPALPIPTLPRPPNGIKKRRVKPTPKLPTGMKCLPLTTYFTDIEHNWEPTIRLTSQGAYQPAKRQPKLPNIRDYMYTNKPPPLTSPSKSHPIEMTCHPILI